MGEGRRDVLLVRVGRVDGLVVDLVVGTFKVWLSLRVASSFLLELVVSRRCIVGDRW